MSWRSGGNLPHLFRFLMILPHFFDSVHGVFGNETKVMVNQCAMCVSW